MSDQPKANFLLAYSKLNMFLAADADAELRRTAVIQAFEYTFETGWKFIRTLVIEAGEVPNGPRDCIVKACNLGIIETDAEEDWLDMLSDRNNTTHTYNEKLAIEIEGRIRTRYCRLFASIA